MLLSAWAVAADGRFEVALDNEEHRTEFVRLPYCHIFLAMEEVGGDGTVKVTVELENRGETNELMLFDYAYDEKVLRKMRPSVMFDKIFGGTKGRRTIEACRGIESMQHIGAAERTAIFTFYKRSGDCFACRLPVYIARYKGKRFNKLLLLEKQVVELMISVEIKPDREYIGLCEACDTLVASLENVLFCTNRKHPVPLEEQKQEWRDKIGALRNRIDALAAKRNYAVSDEGYRLLDELRRRLDEIDLDAKEGDCGKHAVGCRYCSLSLQQIYHRLDDYYQRIYSSNDRKAARAQWMREINALYNCATGHPGRRGNGYKAKITSIYKRIGQF